ncbi:hypothetical protein CBR_g38090 [Chara braunii]|uniref:Uncharacterized protein n=1 Tax=Chara braunii TaxID=69332 RepID=A0A388K0A3_CHABU|nr:hypothetical protein CBR_g38090 [Chara braunii]|eukprot:GBG63472.1 hypothetical protein CBR_g38090 [Chara braunii]
MSVRDRGNGGVHISTPSGQSKAEGKGVHENGACSMGGKCDGDLISEDRSTASEMATRQKGGKRNEHSLPRGDSQPLRVRAELETVDVISLSTRPAPDLPRVPLTEEDSSQQRSHGNGTGNPPSDRSHSQEARQTSNDGHAAPDTTDPPIVLNDRRSKRLKFLYPGVPPAPSNSTKASISSLDGSNSTASANYGSVSESGIVLVPLSVNVRLNATAPAPGLGFEAQDMNGLRAMKGIHKMVEYASVWHKYDPPQVDPLAEQSLYHWGTSEWSLCSNDCGGGTQEREVFCQAKDDESRVSDLYCLYDDLIKPPASRICNIGACMSYQLQPGAWEECSATCGGGTQIRKLYCVDTLGRLVESSLCPETVQENRTCNEVQCGDSYWWGGDWDRCSATCGGGTKKREVGCFKSNGEPIDKVYCTGAPNKPADEQACNISPCEYFYWKVTHWSTCTGSCTNGTRSRMAECVDEQGERSDEESCSGIERPATTMSCIPGGCTFCETEPCSPVSTGCKVLGNIPVKEYSSLLDEVLNLLAGLYYLNSGFCGFQFTFCSMHIELVMNPLFILRTDTVYLTEKLVEKPDQSLLSCFNLITGL